MLSSRLLSLSIAIVISALELPLYTQPQISGPTTGYVFIGGQFRPIIGIPGSAYLGPPASHSAQFGRVAPNGVSGIAVGDSGVQFVRDLGEANAIRLVRSIVPTDVYWSPDSSAFALYSSQTHELQFVRAESSTFKALRPSNLNELGVPTRPIAVNASASLAAVCSKGELAVVGGQALMTTSVSCDGLSAGVFANKNRLFVAGNGRVLEIENWQYGGSVRTVVDISSLNPVAVAVLEGSNGSELLLVNPGENRLYAYNVTTGLETGRFDLDYAPSSVDQLRQGTFLLNRDRKAWEPLLIFQVLPQRAVTFVPVGE